MLFLHFLPAGGALLVHLSHYHLVFLPPQPRVVFIPGSLFYVCSSSGSICSFAHLTTRPMVAHTNARMHTCVADWPVNRHGQDCFPRTDYWKNTLGFFFYWRCRQNCVVSAACGAQASSPPNLEVTNYSLR